MMRSNLKKLLFPVAMWVVLLASPVLAQDEHGDEHEEGLVLLSAAELVEFNIGLAVAGPAEMHLVRTLPAEVRINKNHLAHIVPRYEGVVTNVFFNVGESVQDGDVLAIVESDESLAPYEVVTSTAGTIVEKHMTRGEPVTRDDSGFLIVDLKSVWIDITVYQRDLNLITVGKQATVAARTGEASVTGTISYVTPIIDPHTRTATARLVVENPDGQWRPGMFVMADVLTESFTAAVVVPFSAVHVIDGESVIFLATDHGFEPQHVTLGRKGRTQQEITSGLAVGQQYVAVGGFTLKAELGKESFGGGHSH